MTKEVATTPKGGAVAAYDYGQDAGAGFEQHTNEDYAIPFLAVAQSMTPAVQDAKIKNAKAGAIFNTVTNDFYPGEDGVIFIPSHTEHIFVEWVPRERDGGFVAIHQLDSELVKECREKQPFGEYYVKDGKPYFGDKPLKDANDLVETFQVYGVGLMPDKTVIDAVVGFSSTKIKQYKGWMFKARAIQVEIEDGPRKGERINPPLFAHKYHLTTMKTKNNFGQFHVFNPVTFAGEDAESARLAPDHPLYLRARAVRDAVKKGIAKAAMDSLAPEDSRGAKTGSAEGAPY